MYDIVSDIINHAWQSNYTSDQQYIYYICGALIVVFCAVILDGIFSIFRHFWRQDKILDRRKKTTATATTLMDAVGTAITSVLGWVGTVISSLLDANGDLNALLPLFAVGIAISALLLGVKMIKSFIWGA